MKDAKAKGDLAKMGRISKNDLSLSVSFGSKSEESQSNSTSKLAQGSHVDADGNVAIQATQGNIDVKGSDITGKNIALDAKKNVNITAGENSNKTTRRHWGRFFFDKKVIIFKQEMVKVTN